jgi:hyperosmotically inducible periplasmic protein
MLTICLKSIRPFLAGATLLFGLYGSGWGQNTGGTSQKSPDNTSVNQRDRSKSEATADQQTENASDRAITQQIRRSVLEDKSLSTYARNVKIVTQDGNVILKGPVRSMGEKKTVESKAIALASEDRVSSQLEVAP